LLSPTLKVLPVGVLMVIGIMKPKVDHNAEKKLRPFLYLGLLKNTPSLNPTPFGVGLKTPLTVTLLKNYSDLSLILLLKFHPSLMTLLPLVTMS
jgi:hypothetical protein